MILQDKISTIKRVSALSNGYLAEAIETKKVRMVKLYDRLADTSLYADLTEKYDSTGLQVICNLASEGPNRLDVKWVPKIASLEQDYFKGTALFEKYLDKWREAAFANLVINEGDEK